MDSTDVVCPPGTFGGRSIGEGQATHLGRFDLEVIRRFDPVFFTSAGLASYTAANGDQINISFTAEWALNPDGTVTAVAPSTGATGTGRFANIVVVGTDTVTGYPDGSRSEIDHEPSGIEGTSRALENDAP